MEKQVNIPKLRFPEFSGEWEKKKLIDFAPLQRGFDLPVNEIIKGDFPVVFSNGILKFHNEYKVKSPGVVTGRSGTIGKVTYVEEDYWPHNTALWVTNFKNNDPKFVYYFYSKYNLEKFGTGSGVPTLNRNDVHIQEEFFPNFPEQQKIASFLTAVDEKLHGLKKKKSLLEQYKKGMLQKIFSQELRFKADDDSDFPEWEVKNLGEITYKVDKKNKHKEQLPIYSISNQNGFVPQSEQFEGLDSNDRGYDISLYKIVEKNTFAYNPARINVGSIGYSGNDIDRVIISSLYVCFKTVSEINDQFFLFYLQTEHFKNLVIKKGEGGVRIYLFYENFSEITIDVPFLEEQIKIANFLTAIDEKIQLVQGQVNKMEVWKKGLLQKMFV
jgi:type I restriction enzyme S subunit